MASATVCGLSLVPVSAQVGTQKLQGGQADGSYPSESQEWGFWSHSLLHLLRLRWPSDGDPVWKKKTDRDNWANLGFRRVGGADEIEAGISCHFRWVSPVPQKLRKLQ